MSIPRRKSYTLTCGKGWASLYEPILTELTRLGVPVIGVDEDYGRLRISIDRRRYSYRDLPATIRQQMYDAERDSGTICETCGAPGAYRKRGGWFMVRCDRHARGLVGVADPCLFP